MLEVLWRGIDVLLTKGRAWAILLRTMVFGSSALASGSLADPSGSDVIPAAVSWLEGLLLGTVATTIAIIAVSAVGLMMLTGRVSMRHGLTVTVGCFILFGAATIAAGIRSYLPGADQVLVSHRPDAPPGMTPPPPPSPTNHDPYAGASVPMR